MSIGELAKYGVMASQDADGTHRALVIERSGKTAGFSVAGYPTQDTAVAAVADVVAELNAQEQ